MRKNRDCPAINWKDCTNLRQANASPALKAKSAFANAILGPGSATLQGFAATPIGIEATRLKRSPRTIAKSRSAMSSKVFGRSCSLFGTPSGMAAAWARHTAGLNVAWPLEVATVDLSQLGKAAVRSRRLMAQFRLERALGKPRLNTSSAPSHVRPPSARARRGRSRLPARRQCAAISSASAKVRLDQIEVGERIAAVGIDRDRRAPLLPRSGAGVVGAPTIWIANRAGTGSPLTNRRSETIGHGRPASRSRATADIAVPLGACRPHRFDSQTPNRCPTSARNPQKTLIDPKTLRRNADSRRRQ